MKNSGKSKSHTNPQGIRRKSKGMELSPKSIRQTYRFLKDVPEKVLEKVLS